MSGTSTSLWSSEEWHDACWGHVSVTVHGTAIGHESVMEIVSGTGSQ